MRVAYKFLLRGVWALLLCVVVSPVWACSDDEKRGVSFSHEAISFIISETGNHWDYWKAQGTDFDLIDCDLNDNGHDEHIVHVVRSLTCSNGLAACAILVYEGPPDRRIVARFQGHEARASQKRTNGWRDLIFTIARHDGVFEHVYAYNGTEYEERSSQFLRPLLSQKEATNG